MKTSPLIERTVDSTPMSPRSEDIYAMFASSPLLREVHGPDFLNVGWYESGEHPASEHPGSEHPAGKHPAGEGAAGYPSSALVDRLIAWAPTGTKVVADIACGRGAATARVQLHHPRARTIALDRSTAMLNERITISPDSRALFARADAVALPLRNSSADLILCVEAALHFSRSAFFREAARILRPGGRLVLTDLLVDPTEPGWASMVPTENHEMSQTAYTETLTGSGLRVLRIADITSNTWNPYVRALIAAAAELYPAAGQKMRDTLNSRPVHGYLEVVAQR